MGKKNKQLTSNNNKTKSKYMFYHHFNISQQEGSEAETVNSRETLNLLHKDKPWHILTSSKRMVSVVGTFLEEQQLSSTT